MALIEIKDRTLAALRARAEARDLPLDAFLNKILEAATPLNAGSSAKGDEFDHLIDQVSSASPVLPTMSRAEIYGDHD